MTSACNHEKPAVGVGGRLVTRLSVGTALGNKKKLGI
jgi:hypothetical protein